ncbi:MAG TPA: Tim44-like domain-containing protein [Rhodocyclaceae bacterium]|nr:Tim44-like domain-containing protein [Rhodocyclaceae bacterium]
MKRLAIAAFAAVIGLGLASFDADAKRLGGGKSSGMSRDASVTSGSAVPAKPATPSQSTAPTSAAGAAAAAPKPGMSRWLGPLAGLAAGIGLAALFSHLGMGEGMANIFMMLMLAAVAVFAIRWFMNRNRAPALQHAGAGSPLSGNNHRFEPTPLQQPAKVGADGTAGNNYLAAGGAPAQVPAGFDVEGFVRQAKLNFIRLQAANDRGDMDDIRQFTAPEMFAEIQMQHKERGQKPQETDVMELEAELLDVSTENSRYVASVRFYGRIREEAHAAPEVFAEVWHLVRPVDGSTGWLIAGIQQS